MEINSGIVDLYKLLNVDKNATKQDIVYFYNIRKDHINY